MNTDPTLGKPPKQDPWFSVYFRVIRGKQSATLLCEPPSPETRSETSALNSEDRKRT